MDLTKTSTTIQGWMPKLGLKGNPLIVFSLIYGFSQDGHSKFRGSLTYIQEFTGCSRPTIVSVLNGLIEKGLIHKEKGLRSNEYNVNLEVVKKLNQQWLKNLTSASKETLPPLVKKLNHYNNIDNNNNNNIDKIRPSFLKKISSQTVKLLLSNTTYQSLEPEKQELFVNWVKNRKEINKPLKTKRMIEGQIKHFVKYHPKEIKDAVELASEKGWVDIKYAFETKPTVADNLQVPYYAQAKR